MSVIINPKEFESKKRLDALIAAANRKTNGYAENITSAMQTLLDGYGTGGGSAQSDGVAAKAVNFYDYDGTRLYAYTLAEARALTELPTPPEHDGLVFDGWNWELSEVNALTIPAEIGALYNTDDNITRIKIYVDDISTRTFGISTASISNGTKWSIDFGDGTVEECVGKQNPSHTYQSGGTYIIKIKTDGGTFWIQSIDAPNEDFVRAIEFSKECTGTQVSLGMHTQYVTMHNNFGIQGGTVFHTKCKIFPRASIGITARSDIGTQIISLSPTVSSFATYGCTETWITQVSLPEGISNIGSRAYRYCYWLRKVVIPTTVTRIESQAFDAVRRLNTMIVLPKAPPTIQNNTLNELPADCVIYVPDDSVESYKTADYWSVYAGQIQGMSTYIGDDIWRE